MNERTSVFFWAVDQNLRCTLACGELPEPAPKRSDAVGITLDEILERECFGELLTRASVSRNAHLGALAGRAVRYEQVVSGRTLQIHIEPLCDREGSISGSVGVALDVTGQEEAFRALRESESRLRSVMDSLDEGLAFVDPEGCIHAANASAERILGIDRGELLRRPVSDPRWQVVGIDGRPMNPESSPSHITLTTGKPCTDVVFRIVRPDGQPRWLSVNTRPLIRTGESRPHAVVASFTDITERLEVERERARLQAAVAHAAQEWVLTLDGIPSPIALIEPSCRVVRLNRAARNLTGRDYPEIVGQPLSSLGAGEPWQGASTIVGELRAPEATAGRVVQDPTTGRYWDILATRISGDDGPAGRVVLLMRDITRRVELGESLRRTEAMAQLGELLASAAHEVRNALFAISATVDAFQARFGNRDDADPFIESLCGGVDRLRKLMRDLLEYGKPMTLNLTTSTLQRVVDEAVEACRPIALERRVHVARLCEPGLGPTPIDPDRMLQVLQNVLENAIQFSPEGGTVAISLHANGGAVRRLVCAVRDQGPGFDPRDLAKVFAPFFSRRHGGTGVGLALAKKIVELHGGSISAANSGGGGAEVTLALPWDGPLGARS